jgi:serine/threonine protein kinase
MNYLLTGTEVKTARNRAAEGKTILAVKNWNPIAHLDIKPANIFITNEDSLGTDKTPFPTLILGDFDCSKSYNDILSGKSRKYAHSGQTPASAPPESSKWNERDDIYMLGLTIHCLGQMRGEPDLKNHFPLSPRYKNENLRKLIKQCIKTDPHDRPKANDLPAIVYSDYKSWRKKRDDDGAKLQKRAV